MNPPLLDFEDFVTGRHCQVSQEAVIGAAVRLMRQPVLDASTEAGRQKELADLRILAAEAQAKVNEYRDRAQYFALATNEQTAKCQMLETMLADLQTELADVRKTATKLASRLVNLNPPAHEA